MSCGLTAPDSDDSDPSRHISKAFGGPQNDLPFALLATYDNGVIAGGYTESFGEGSRDSIFFKLDSNGEVQWQYTMGGAQIEDIQSIAQAPDGGFLLCGYTQSYGAGEYDMWLVKLNQVGVVEWQKTYGGTGTEFCKSAQYISDGNLVVAGYTGSWGKGAHDVWVLKLDPQGEVIWQYAYGTSDVENTYSIQETSDHGFLIAGHLHPLTGTNRLLIWVMKLDAEGSIVWQSIYGGFGSSHTTSAIEASSGGYVLAAYSDIGGAGGYDVLILKLTPDGGIKWANYYGGPDDDFAYVVREARPGEFIVTGGTGSEMLTLSVDDEGSLTGWHSIGGAGVDISAAYSIAQSDNGILYAAAKSDSWGLGGYDMWILSRDVSMPLVMDGGGKSIVASPGVYPAAASMVATDSIATPSSVEQRPIAMDCVNVPVTW